jgi:excisionase family DNA binding protein
MSDMSTIPGFYTVHEAAVVIQRSHSQVCRYIKKGDLPAKRIGREILVPIEEAKKFKTPPMGNPNFQKRN